MYVLLMSVYTSVSIFVFVSLLCVFVLLHSDLSLLLAQKTFITLAANPLCLTYM